MRILTESTSSQVDILGVLMRELSCVRIWEANVDSLFFWMHQKPVFTWYADTEEVGLSEN